jgi:hypothetical protein
MPMMEEQEERVIRVRFISQERFDLYRSLIERCTRKRLDEEGDLPAVYGAARHNNWHGRAYMVHDAEKWIDPVFRKRIIYRPMPKEEST